MYADGRRDGAAEAVAFGVTVLFAGVTVDVCQSAAEYA